MKSYKRIKMCIAAVLMLCAVLSYGTISAKAEIGTGAIKGTNVNVRSDAGTSAQKVNTLTNGDAVIVTGTKTAADGNVWYEVSFMKNSKQYIGYIISNYVNYIPSEQSQTTGTDTQAQTGAQAQTDPQTGSSQQSTAAGTSSQSKWKTTVTASNVNVRKKAVSGSVVGKVTTGASVTVRKSKNGTDGKLWYYISFKADGKTKKGWIRSDFIDASKAPASVPAGEGAQTQEDAAVSDGETQIDVSGSLQQEQDTAGQETSESKPATTKRTGVMTGNNVRIRKKPVNGNVICQLMSGAELTIKSEKTGTDNMVWYKVKFKYNGKNKTGYVRSDFVKISETEQTTVSQETSATGETTTDAQTAGTSKAKKKGMLTGDYVRIRKKPVNGNVICQLMTGAELTIKSEKTGTDNMVWYKVKFKYNGKNKTGYVRSDFVQVQVEESAPEDTTTVDMTADTDFEAYLTQQGFPESYKDSLRALHAAHPTWVFKAVNTGLTWSDVIAAESKVGTNLVTKNAISSWKSKETAAYNWKTNAWYTFDGGAWVAASSEIISYYMDPRNFLTESAIFQFETLQYEAYQGAAGVEALLANSFMAGEYTEPDGTTKKYSDTFVEVGQAVGVSPYHLAARCYQEQGKGTSGSISGAIPGYTNIFNYYNIGAYAANGNSPVVQGLIYAASQAEGDANYDRPWNTRYKSLLGGAKYVAQKYVNLGQNTLYFQKFNVVNAKNGIYKHQYMTNVQAAESEAVKMSAAYTDAAAALVFYIPVYNEMPETVCAKPTGTANPNNYLATLEVEGKELTPVFDAAIDTYDLTVKKKVKKVTINATAVASTSTVTGTGKVKLARGQNTFYITCTAEDGTQKVYTINIVRK